MSYQWVPVTSLERNPGGTNFSSRLTCSSERFFQNYQKITRQLSSVPFVVGGNLTGLVLYERLEMRDSTASKTGKLSNVCENRRDGKSLLLLDSFWDVTRAIDSS